MHIKLNKLNFYVKIFWYFNSFFFNKFSIIFKFIKNIESFNSDLFEIEIVNDFSLRFFPILSHKQHRHNIPTLISYLEVQWTLLIPADFSCLSCSFFKNLVQQNFPQPITSHKQPFSKQPISLPLFPQYPLSLFLSPRATH